VALRIGIGLHFYFEGVGKLREPQPFSAGFLLNAKGHLAPVYRSMVWDADGLARLDAEAASRIWDHYRQRAASAYGWTAEQAAQAQRIYDSRRAQLQSWIDLHESDIAEYQRGLERRDRYWTQSDRMQVAGLRSQVDALERELAAQRRRLVAPIDRLWESYVRDLRSVAAMRGEAAGLPPIDKPGRRFGDSETIDEVVRYFDIAVGACLILGLFARPAAILGALFLCGVMASQWPGSPGAVPIWPQLIEMLSLLVLAATGAGRFAGLDFLLGAAGRWCCPTRQGADP
jgi:uncharacterized membrane protein YphA (DoxX/SURF4 family)